MPGIVGLITARPRAQAEVELQRMVDVIRHESFYATGTWIDPSLGVYVGWCVRDPAPGARQPLRSARDDVVLLFSGEEFSASGPVPRCPEDGHDLDADGTDSLLRSYDADPAFPAGLNGRFHGLVVDRRRPAVVLFNDRYGLHRLYYHQAIDAFYFAAEAKAILRVRPELRRIEPRALGELVSCGCVLENRSLFDGIHVLPGASKWILRGRGIEARTTYFEERDWEAQPPLDPEASYAALREVIADRFPRYFTARGPVGISLTGGIDTRMILAWVHPEPRATPCYTFAGMLRDCHDARLARRIAHACGQSHHVIRVGEIFLRDFAALAERSVYLTDGCTDVSRSADLYVNRIARQIAPVRMTGNYGSEVLRGVRAFRPVSLPSALFSGDFLPQLHQAEQTYAAVSRAHPVSFAVFRQAPWHHYGLLKLEESQLALRSPFLDNDLVRTVFRMRTLPASGEDVCLRLIADGDPALRRIPTDRGAGARDLLGALAGALHEIQFKAEYAYDSGMPHWLAGLDRLLAPLHPEQLFIDRHRFTHFRLWYRGPLAKHVKQVLGDPRTLSLPILEPRAVASMVHDHLAGAGNYTVVIHKLLTLELIHRLFTSNGLDHT